MILKNNIAKMYNKVSKNIAKNHPLREEFDKTAHRYKHYITNINLLNVCPQTKADKKKYNPPETDIKKPKPKPKPKKVDKGIDIKKKVQEAKTTQSNIDIDIDIDIKEKWYEYCMDERGLDRDQCDFIFNKCKDKLPQLYPNFFKKNG